MFMSKFCLHYLFKMLKKMLPQAQVRKQGPGPRAYIRPDPGAMCLCLKSSQWEVS